MGYENGLLVKKTFQVTKAKKEKLSFFDNACIFVFVSSFLFPLLESIGFPHFIYYVNDCIMMLMFVILITKKSIKHKSLVLALAINFIFSIVSVFVGSFSLPLFLWGMRNVYRFFVFFFFCLNYISEKAFSRVFYIFKIFFSINLLLTLLEYLIGIRQDYLGGIFGWEKGCNSYTTVFIFLSYSFYLFSFVYKKSSSLIEMIYGLLGCFLVAALAEIKFLFVVFLVETFFVCVFSKKSSKKILFFVSFLFLVFLFVLLMGTVSNYQGSDLLKIDYWVTYFSESSTKGYNSINDVNRLGFIQTLDNYLNFPLINRIFGMGQGFAESSSFDFLQSDFATTYASILHFDWFMSSFTYIEKGIVGIVSYLTFFILLFAHFLKNRKMFFSKIGMAVSIFSIILFFYNVSLRMDTSGYMLFLSLSVLYCLTERKGARI